MLAALVLAAALSGHKAPAPAKAAPKPCAADLNLAAEPLEQKLDITAVSPPSVRRSERECLVQAAGRTLGLPKPLDDSLPGVDAALAVGRSFLFEDLADRLRALCPDPAWIGARRPKACGKVGLAKPSPQIVPIDQSEQGFELWLRVEPGRATQAKQIHAFLDQHKVGVVAPLYQILRTASDWQSCGGEPFALPPKADWERAAKTLAWIDQRVKPALGPVEFMSGYREPALNACADGAKESAHLGFWALDLEPLTLTIDRAGLMQTLCQVHKDHGKEADIGLGFYSGVRFHIDDKRFRHWGFDPDAAPACAVTPIPPSPPGLTEGPGPQSATAGD